MSWGDDRPPEQLRPMNLGDVLDGTFRLPVRHWRAFTIGLGVIAVPLALLSTLLVAGAAGFGPGFLEIFQSLQDPDGAADLAAETPPFDVAGLLAAAAVSTLATVVLTPLLYGAATHIAATGFRSGETDGLAGVRFAGRRYLALLAALVLFGLIPLVVFLVPVVPLALGAAIDIPALVVVGSVGLLASFVLAVVVATRLMLAIPVVVIEETGPIRALSRSNELVKGRTWVMLGSVVVVYVITLIVGSVLSLPFSIVGALFGEVSGAVANTVGNILGTVVSTSLYGAAIVLFYFDRRVRKEGFDLSALAAELGADPGADARGQRPEL